MRKLKYFIAVVILFITIGFAAINYTLSIDGDTELTGDLNDFKVYFSKLKINGVDSPEAIISDTELYVSGVIDAVGDTYTVDYDITNSSKLFDANITMNCTGASDYLSVTNNFDTTNALSALSTRSGTLVFTKIKTIASTDSFNFNVSCKFVASPVEREAIGSGSVVAPLNPYYIGREVAIGTEKFNIISTDDDTVTMLAQYNIDGNSYRQTDVQVWSGFTDTAGWDFEPDSKEINIFDYQGITKTVLNNYLSYLKELTNEDFITIDLISLEELGSLGCIFDYTYQYSDGATCDSSSYAKWIVNGQNWWTKSIAFGQDDSLWFVHGEGLLLTSEYVNLSGVRPTITISKEVAEQLLRVYPIGKEISIGTEKFNVISDNATTVTMLAQKNISDSTPYKQTDTQIRTVFSDSYGWENRPGPKEIDIWEWSPYTSELVDNYVSYLKTQYNVDVTGDLITMTRLGNLGCTIPTDYGYGSGGWTCTSSEHSEWLVNGQGWWTRSANSGSSASMWFMNDGGSLSHGNFYYSYGVRPVITISKEDLT